MALLPIGPNNKFKTVKRGDVLKLVTGEEVIFEEMKRTRFSAKFDKKTVSVPLYRDKKQTIPFVKEIIGHDSTSVPKKVNPSSLKPGNLFIIEGKKGTYMFQKETPNSIHGVELSTRKPYSIRKGDFNIIQIHLKKLYEDFVK